jgi:hypothetical protein
MPLSEATRLAFSTATLIQYSRIQQFFIEEVFIVPAYDPFVGRTTRARIRSTASREAGSLAKLRDQAVIAHVSSRRRLTESQN